MAKIDKIIQILRNEVERFQTPIVTEIAEETSDPFKVLISCILSLRTKNDVTAAASKRLFKLADSTEKMLKLSQQKIQKTIYPVGFYATKARTIRNIAEVLIDKYNSKVPDDLDELLKLKGVGRKTANLVITMAYGKPGICVDIHVHRISNRLGIIKTKTPEESEYALMKVLPKKYWIEYNDLLVSYGQNICKPISPFCSKCKIANDCERVGVTRSR